MRWWRRVWSWLRITMLERQLSRHGYRRLHGHQAAEASSQTRLVLHDTADAVLALQAVTDKVEEVLMEMEEGND
jgi:hypothetical protein